jgi:hypothetical protein
MESPTTTAFSWRWGLTRSALQYLNGVAYGGGRWVATGAFSQLLVSQDAGASAWQRVNLDAQGLEGVAYGNGRFVVSGQLGRLFTSTDGLAWQAVSSGTDANLGNAVFGGGRFLVFVPYRGEALTSTDGLTWTRVSGLGARAATYANGRWVAVGWGEKAFLSQDGLRWSEEPLPGYRSLNAVAYGNGLYVAVGDYGHILIRRE